MATETTLKILIQLNNMYYTKGISHWICSLFRGKWNFIDFWSCIIVWFHYINIVSIHIDNNNLKKIRTCAWLLRWWMKFSVISFFFFLLYTCVISIALFKQYLAKSLQSCPTLCDPIDGSPPGSPIPGILQARTLE